MLRLKIPKQSCQLCGKSTRTGFHRSHSHRRVKRLFQPNLVKVKGFLFCARCLKTLKNIV